MFEAACSERMQPSDDSESDEEVSLLLLVNAFLRVSPPPAVEYVEYGTPLGAGDPPGILYDSPV